MKPHGIRGEFSVLLESDFPQWVARQPRLFAEVGGRLLPWDVTSARLNGKRLFLTIAQLVDRTAVEDARGTALLVPEQDAREASDDPDYFLNSDLVGLTVIHADHKLGQVRKVIEMPGQNLLEVARPEGSTFLFPFAHKLIERIDLNAGTLFVYLPEGLLDLNEIKGKAKQSHKE